MKLKKLLNIHMYPEYLSWWMRGGAKKSYSQTGEDLLACRALKSLGISKPTYLDIGANDPKIFNNTYLLYKRGSHGVCVEPYPPLALKLRKARPRDTVIEAAVGLKTGTATLFLNSAPELNSITEKRDSEKSITVPTITLQEIIETYFDATPDFISLDIEGMDFSILKSFDFSKHRPAVFSVETISFARGRGGRKLVEIIEYMLKQNYFVYADTHINTIFVDKVKWGQE